MVIRTYAPAGTLLLALCLSLLIASCNVQGTIGSAINIAKSGNLTMVKLKENATKTHPIKVNTTLPNTTKTESDPLTEKFNTLVLGQEPKKTFGYKDLKNYNPKQSAACGLTRASSLDGTPERICPGGITDLLLCTGDLIGDYIPFGEEVECVPL